MRPVKRYALGIILFLFVTSNVFASAKLVFSIDLIRHGDRTALHAFPAMPYFEKAGPGQLTPEGMHQAFQLGSRLRQAYIEQEHLLPPHYQAGTLYVRSTDTDRTLMTAQSALFGLYPLGSGPALANNQPALPGGFQPIPIHTVPTKQDNLLYPAFDKAWLALVKREVETLPKWRAKNNELKGNFAKWSKALGIKITNLSQLISIGDTLYIYQLHHIPLPTGLTNEDVNEIKAAGRWVVITQFKQKLIGQAMGMHLVKIIGKYMQDNKNSNLKCLLLFAHDTTILSLMSALGAPLSEPPPYVADVKFKLYQTDQNGYEIKISFNEQPVYVPICHATTCTLRQFLNITN